MLSSVSETAGNTVSTPSVSTSFHAAEAAAGPSLCSLFFIILSLSRVSRVGKQIDPVPVGY